MKRKIKIDYWLQVVITFIFVVAMWQIFSGLEVRGRITALQGNVLSLCVIAIAFLYWVYLYLKSNKT